MKFDQSPFDPGFVQNPYPTYSAMRAAGDFVHWDHYGFTMATTYEAVSTVLRHKGMGRVPPDGSQRPDRDLDAFYRVEAFSLLELEPPAHTHLRRIVVPGFTSGRVATMAPQISQIADQLIAAIPTDEPFDLIQAFARDLPVIAIARLLGLPDEMAPQLLAWSNDMVAMYQARRDADIEQRANTAAAEFTAYLEGIIDDRRRTPAPDLLTDLISAESQGETLTMDELISTSILLLNAGHEATVHTIGNAVRALLAYPDPDRTCALRPHNIEGTVEECLRYDPPLHLFTRYVYEPTEVLGHMFEAGEQIGCLLASASRDDAVWPDGEVFDPFRASRTHLAFGAGIHFCLGAPLARLELQIALPLLFAQCKNLELVEEPTVADLYHFRGLERLMLRC